MTAVFVHGVPETGKLWDRLRACLKGGSAALDLPGFGTPRPEGYDGTMDEDARWMAADFDGTMGTSVLDLYRSATPNPHHHWGASLATPTRSPGLVLQPSLDLEDPATAAAALERFWDSLER